MRIIGFVDRNEYFGLRYTNGSYSEESHSEKNVCVAYVIQMVVSVKLLNRIMVISFCAS